jgi:hypothetical protein
VFGRSIGRLMAYLKQQMTAGRLRPMPPLLAIQAIIGPNFFHLMTRPAAEQIVGVPVDMDSAIDELVAAALDGLVPSKPEARS